MEQLTILNLAHLHWDHVWQRPQQLMTRFAEHCRVIYVDPPRVVASATRPHLQARRGAGGVEVFRPIFPAEVIEAYESSTQQSRPSLLPSEQVAAHRAAEGNVYQQLWLELLPEVLALAGPNILLWVTSPLSDYLVAAARPEVNLVVYDCMDDLASFRDGNEEMRQRETNLLEMADLLFTGGYSMYEARKDRHARAYCFPSGVDVDHYRKVSAPSTRIPKKVSSLPQPRLGYFGVLDERLDWELIATVAEQRPSWQWLLVGPRAKVKRSELPRLANIHYLGKQQYDRLPAFLKGFDIATMPFALNESTRFISPTKTLEYLAGNKQVVSSSVADVVAFYSHIVHIADGAESWIQTIEQMLAATPEQIATRLDAAQPILAASTWDSIAEQMWKLMSESLVTQDASKMQSLVLGRSRDNNVHSPSKELVAKTRRTAL